jgi:hypothetical protein
MFLAGPRLALPTRPRDDPYHRTHPSIDTVASS